MFDMIFTSSLLSILLALVVLVFNWKVNRNALFLSLLMILIGSGQLRHYLIFHGTDPFWLAILVNNPSPLWSMTGACLFFYVRSVLTDRFEFRKADLLHTIPFWVSLVGIMPYLFSPFSGKIEVANLFIRKMEAIKDVEFNWLMDHEWSLRIRYIIQIGYALACLWMLIQFKRRRTIDPNRPIGQKSLIHKWLVAVTVFVLLDALYFSMGTSIYFKYYPLARSLPMNFPEMNLMGMILTSIPMLVIVFPEILYGIPRRQETPPIAKDTNMAVPLGKVPHSALLPDPEAATTPTFDKPGPGSQDPFAVLGQRVIDIMEQEKPYLLQDFSIEELAVMLGVPRHHLYYCFKNVLKKKFVILRTEYRIREVKKVLLEADLDNTTLEAIGWSCGFASRSAFYRIFTEQVGCSPGEFIEQHKRPE